MLARSFSANLDEECDETYLKRTNSSKPMRAQAHFVQTDGGGGGIEPTTFAQKPGLRNHSAKSIRVDARFLQTDVGGGEIEPATFGQKQGLRNHSAKSMRVVARFLQCALSTNSRGRERIRTHDLRSEARITKPLG